MSPHFPASAFAFLAIFCPAAVSAATVTIDVRGPDGAPLTDAVVMVEVPGARADTMRGPFVMEQKAIAFQPHVLVVPVGASVTFPNRDTVRHHVYSFSKARKFDLKLYGREDQRSLVFDTPGIVTLGCNIHDWMLAYIYVVTTPYFAKTAADGKARLDGLTPGTYEARVWQPRMRGGAEKTAQPVTLAVGEPAQVAFVVSLKAEWRVPRAPDSYKGVQGS